MIVTWECKMTRLFVLVLGCSLVGCASKTYTIEAANLADADSRALRYCYLQSSKAELAGVERRNGRTVELYRCVPGTELPARPLNTTR
jgi:hypothetical protein